MRNTWSVFVVLALGVLAAVGVAVGLSSSTGVRLPRPVVVPLGSGSTRSAAPAATTAGTTAGTTAPTTAADVTTRTESAPGSNQIDVVSPSRPVSSLPPPDTTPQSATVEPVGTPTTAGPSPSTTADGQQTATSTDQHASSSTPATDSPTGSTSAGAGTQSATRDAGKTTQDAKSTQSSDS